MATDMAGKPEQPLGHSGQGLIACPNHGMIPNAHTATNPVFPKF